MKIRIAYIPEEEREATAIMAVLRPLLPGARVRKSEGKPPFIHLFLVTKTGRKPCEIKKNR